MPTPNPLNEDPEARAARINAALETLHDALAHIPETRILSEELISERRAGAAAEQAELERSR